jgi:hypothetical protein
LQNNDNSDNNHIGSFVEIYEQAVIDSLLIFGHHISGIVLLYMKEKYSIIQLGDTATNPKILLDALESLLNGGAKIAQRRILRLLYRRIGIEQSFSIAINFEEKIHKARKEFEKKCNHSYRYRKE